MRIGPYDEISSQEIARNVAHPTLMAVLILVATLPTGTPWLIVSLMGVELMMLQYWDRDRAAGWFRYMIWLPIGVFVLGVGGMAVGVQDAFNRITLGWVVAIIGVCVATPALHSALKDKGLRPFALDMLIAAAGGCIIALGSHFIHQAAST